jgi:hypothetical protein
MTDGKLKIYAHPRIQTNCVNVMYRLFTLLCSVMQLHGLVAPAVQGVSDSQGQALLYLRVFRELKLAHPLHLPLISGSRYAFQRKYAVLVSKGQSVVPACGRRVSKRYARVTVPVAPYKLTNGTSFLTDPVHAYIRQFGQLALLAFLPFRILLLSLFSSGINQAIELLLCFLLPCSLRPELFLSCPVGGTFFRNDLLGPK